MAGSIRPSGGSTATDAVAGRLHFDQHVLDLDRGCLLTHGEEVALRPKTFELLRYLASRPGRLLSKDELLSAVWPDVVVTGDSLVQCVAELRRALNDDDQRLIRTVPRRGYRFDAMPREELPLAGKRMPPARLGAIGPHDARAAPPLKRHASTLLAIGVVALLMAAAGVSWWWLGPGRSTPAPPLSIVVLPFDNLGHDPDQAFLGEGIASDLTTELARLPGLFVIAQATARTLEGEDRDAGQIGRELNVRYLLDGDVRRTGDRIRISVRLVDTAAGASVWAQRYERAGDRLLAWQDEVVGRIAIALNLELTRHEGERARLEGGDDPEAHELATRGWALVYTAKMPDTYDAARVLFAHALERDPRAVNAMVGLGWTSAVSVLDGWSASPEADFANAESAVARALALDPDHFVAHHVRGFLFRLQRRSQAAHDAFRTALALNPNFASGHAQLGVTALELGRPEETVAAVERAIALSPRDPNLGPWLAIAGMAELHLGHADRAVVWLTRAIDTGTPVALHQAYLASALALAGRRAGAKDALAAFRAAKPRVTISLLRAQALSTEPAFLRQRHRLYEGLRLAGLPD